MTFSSFALQLALLSVAVWIALVIVHQIPGLGDEPNFSWLSWGAFILISMGMFVLGKRAAYDENKGLFVSMAIFLGAGKMLLSVILFVAYTLLVNPIGKGFAIPFFLIYLSFTIFETYFMMKLSYEKRELAKTNQKIESQEKR